MQNDMIDNFIKVVTQKSEWWVGSTKFNCYTWRISDEGITITRTKEIGIINRTIHRITHEDFTIEKYDVFPVESKTSVMIGVPHDIKYAIHGNYAKFTSIAMQIILVNG